MSIEATRELETLASVCPELNMANYTEDDVRHLNDWAIEMSLLAEKVAAVQQAEPQQPATAITCGIPGMAKTTCPYCEHGFAFEHEQPATPEPVDFPAGAIVNGRTLMDRIEAYPFASEGGDLRMCSDWHELRRCFEHLADYVSPRPAPSVPADVVRDAERYRWLRKTRFIWSDFRHISGVHPAVVGLEFQWFPTQAQQPAREDLDVAIDAAMLAAKVGGKQ